MNSATRPAAQQGRSACSSPPRPARRGGPWLLAAVALCAGLGLAPRGILAAAPEMGKDQSRIGAESQIPAGAGAPLGPAGEEALPAEGAPPGGPDGADAPATREDQEELPLDALIMQDIPNLKAVELDVDKARKALDAFAAINGKYDDAEIAKYATLQEFADKTEAGRRMQEQIRSFGFRDVEEWNLVIMNIGFAYTSLREGGDAPVRQQIRNIENNPDIPEERKKRAVESLKVLIPSANNRKVVEALMKDPAYAEKLKLLDADDVEE